MEKQKYCLPPGFSLPPPTDVQTLPSLPGFKSALESQPWFNNTTIAIKASIGGSLVFQYAYRADGGNGGDLFDTKIRIASVTKVFTVLAVLLSKESIGWEDRITKFVPGLNETAYADVTIGALAGQTSGLGRFVCSRPQVLDMFNDTPYLPSSCNSGPLYSNIAYNLLAMALEHVHSKRYEQIIQELIFDPIGMQNSTFETPDNDKDGILPQDGERWFAAPFGNFNPSGGIWSTPNDMLLFLEALQSHRFLSASQTRKWLQPSSLLPSIHQLVGAPWEIFRPTDIDVAVPRPIDLYTKAGGIAGYSSHAVLVPEYGVALTIHAAGDDAVAAVQGLLPLVVKPLLSHADEQVRSQASMNYVGTYRTDDGSSSIEIVLDDGPGLRIESALINGVAIIPALAAVQGLDPSNASARLYPTDADFTTSDSVAFRLLLDRIKEGTERGFVEQYCASWNWGDTMRYASEPLDRLVFSKSADQGASLELVGWRTTLRKTELARGGMD
ncbi:hypothetical protein N0V90_009193 [Kalmusia sp. IMI 367209]|nr:hypothetical protein N0V90_009193 [Kalmusia sp. IMI 367209]